MDETEKPERVNFRFEEQPGSWFFELGIRFGERTEWIGGSRALANPEDALMAAALAVLEGGAAADARMPAENDGFTLGLRVLPGRDQRGAGGGGDRACELVWSEVDARGAVIESRRLGVARSVVQLAEAVLELGEVRYAARAPSAALTALRSALQT